MLSIQDKVEIILICGENITSRQASEIFNHRHGTNISPSTISRILRRFKETGSVSNCFKKPHRKWVVNEENTENIIATVVENGRTSISKLSEESNISSTSIRRILKDNKFHPYKPKVVQTLREPDFNHRFDFSAWYEGQVEENIFFPRKILWTDEATFTTNGVVSSQNSRWWADENPGFIVDANDQVYQKINVLCGILDDQIIGPFFFHTNLTSQMYANFLGTNLWEIIEGMPLNLRRDLWFQLDGASIHSTREVRNILDEMFPGKWIGRFSDNPWPARSPDLTPLDFFLWGYLKNKVYAERPFRSIDVLIESIRRNALAIPPQFLRNAVREVHNRTMLCMERNGRHVEF